MKHKIKIAVFAAGPFLLALAFWAVYNSSDVRGRAGNALSSIYENDRNKDGVVDSVYYYTYDINANQVKLEIDSDNDGEINKVYCYCLGTDTKNRLF